MMYRLWRTKRKSLAYVDPIHAGRHPFQVFMLALCLVAGLPLIFGKVTAGSTEALLPPLLVAAWGGLLFGGSAIALTGSMMPREHVATGLQLEQLGLTFVGDGAIIYALCVLMSVGWSGFLAACIVAGFGAACLRRAWDINRIVRRAIAMPGNTADRLPVLREFETEAEAIKRQDEDS